MYLRGGRKAKRTPTHVELVLAYSGCPFLLVPSKLTEEIFQQAFDHFKQIQHKTKALDYAIDPTAVFLRKEGRKLELWVKGNGFLKAVVVMAGCSCKVQLLAVINYFLGKFYSELSRKTLNKKFGGLWYSSPEPKTWMKNLQNTLGSWVTYNINLQFFPSLCIVRKLIRINWYCTMHNYIFRFYTFNQVPKFEHNNPSKQNQN
ncbi:hypothetical protein K435DRAFT_802115 [Dendrothele bispora CBS 962.96]|uniref:Uncharacterized protein n=1 Tax=Dendrothele bispora (strain CBS 962.96) TaxID=1314807 RepID=A0A4S8LM37_DENBC|nr:hypothetical protein K435DRAFT_802115 [Dendrothele bispora CBS 962.96]